MKLLVLDKDGTLVKSKSGNTFVQHPEDQELLPGVKEAIQRYHSEGWAIVVASNQGGVAAGHKTLEDAIAEMRYLMGLLPEIQSCYFCPDFEGDTVFVVYESALGKGFDKFNRLPIDRCGFRKPDPGMINLARKQIETEYLHIEQIVNEILFVGDTAENEDEGNAAGVRFMWANNWRDERSSNILRDQ